MSDQPQLPSKFEMLLSLNDTLKDILKRVSADGRLLVPEEVAKERLKICFNCDKFIQQPENSPMPYRCAVCGCGMKIKTRLAAAHCPINKWDKYTP